MVRVRTYLSAKSLSELFRTASDKRMKVWEQDYRRQTVRVSNQVVNCEYPLIHAL